MRLFTAIELPGDVCDVLVAAQELLKQRITRASWTTPANLHVTLKFLGEVPDNQVMGVCDALLAIALPRFQLRVADLGTFPPRGAARVLFAGVAGETEGVSELFDSIE